MGDCLPGLFDVSHSVSLRDMSLLLAVKRDDKVKLLEPLAVQAMISPFSMVSYLFFFSASSCLLPRQKARPHAEIGI